MKSQNALNPFMRQYSTYINNFDFALSRLASWATIHDKFTSGTAAGGVGLGISTSEANNSQLTPAQRKYRQEKIALEIDLCMFRVFATGLREISSCRP
jgi:hypothetical protein